MWTAPPKPPASPATQSAIRGACTALQHVLQGTDRLAASNLRWLRRRAVTYVTALGMQAALQVQAYIYPSRGTVHADARIVSQCQEDALRQPAHAIAPPGPEQSLRDRLSHWSRRMVRLDQPLHTLPSTQHYLAQDFAKTLASPGLSGRLPETKSLKDSDWQCCEYTGDALTQASADWTATAAQEPACSGRRLACMLSASWLCLCNSPALTQIATSTVV